jgi:hypothetical protein
MTRELVYVTGLTGLMILLAAFIYNAPPLEAHADPLITPLHITSPWYFLWLQGLLKIGDKVLWGLVIPTGLVGFILLLPYFEVGPSRRYGARRIGLSAAAMSVAALAVLSFMGSPWYKVTSSPDQEAIAALLPQTHPGPLREAPWDELEFGTYQANQWAAAPTPALQELLQLFDGKLIEAVGPDQPNAQAYLIVEDWQTGLKKVTLRVTWDNPDGTTHEASQSVYLHSDSAYAGG